MLYTFLFETNFMFLNKIYVIYVLILEDFLSVLKNSLQICWKILKKCFLGTACIDNCLGCLNLKLHNGVLFRAKGLTDRKAMSVLILRARHVVV